MSCLGVSKLSHKVIRREVGEGRRNRLAAIRPQGERDSLTLLLEIVAEWLDALRRTGRRPSSSSGGSER